MAYIEHRISNIVAKSQTSRLDLDDLFCLDDLFLTLSNKKCRYTSAFPAVFAKFSQGTCTFFSTGTVTMNGCKSLASVNELCEELNSLGYHAKFGTPAIVNVVSQFYTNRRAFLEIMKNSIDAIYEPELSNSLHIRFDKSVRTLLHGSGNGIITGVASPESIQPVLDFLIMLLALKHEGYCTA